MPWRCSSHSQRAGEGLFSWLADAAAAKLYSDALAGFLAEWESTHGPLTADEIAEAERELGLRAGDNAA